jgi:hypothetical protein
MRFALINQVCTEQKPKQKPATCKNGSRLKVQTNLSPAYHKEQLQKLEKKYSCLASKNKIATTAILAQVFAPDAVLFK